MKKLLVLFLVIFIPYVIVIWLGYAYIINSEVRYLEKQQHLIRESKLTNSISEVKNELELLKLDVEYLQNLGLIENILVNPKSENLKRLAENFKSFAKARKYYHQIRIINREGKEIIRVNSSNGSASIVNTAFLQDKSSRYYFKDSINLRPGQFYFSKFDLNIENGQIEIPYRPMIRVALPIFNQEAGENLGILIVNYNAQHVLNIFWQFLNGYEKEHTFLLNGNGYWISGSSNENNWAFMFNKQNSFAREKPTLWQTMKRQKDGHIITDQGLYSFKHVLLNSTGSEEDSENVIYAVTRIEREEIEEILERFELQMLTIALILSLGGAIVTAFISSFLLRRQRETEQSQLDFARRKLLDSMAEGLLGVTFEGRCTFINQTALEYLGFQEEELLGENILEKIMYMKQDKTVLPIEENEVYQAIRLKKDYSGEAYFLHKDGRFLPIKLTVICNKGEGVVITFRDISDDIESRKRIYQLNNFDKLTSLLNRDMFANQITDSIRKIKLTESNALLIIIDINRFSFFNETLGKNNADTLLIKLAERIKSNQKIFDYSARIGPDVFGLVVKAVEMENEYRVVHDIVESLTQPFNIGGTSFEISVSCGVCILPSDAKTGEDAIQHAQRAVSTVKSSKLESIKFYSEKLQTRNENTFLLEQDLRNSLKKDELFLEYQPQVSTEDANLTGVEALVRWKNVSRGRMSPIEFLPLAEEIGFMKEIEFFVIEEAIKQRAIWQEQYPSLEFKMAINLSAEHFSKTEMVDKITSLINKYGISPSLITLEITEESMISSPDKTKEILLKLKDFGMELSIDDFGTGYSSLSYLKTLPMDELKIDQSFIRDIGSNDKNKSIVASIISIANNLSLSTVAEGVETVEHLEILKSLNCTNIQGYYYSKPVSPQEIEKCWLS